MFFVAILVACELRDISSCRTLPYPEAFVSLEECTYKLSEGLDFFTSQGLYVSASCHRLLLPGESA